ncbi:MAG: FG-GAP-like repeat-containing protein [Fuerstiella sp.]
MTTDFQGADDGQQRTGISRAPVLYACVGLAAAGVFVFWSLIWTPPETPFETLRRARLALSGGDYAAAEALALQVPESSSQWSDAMLVAGEAATKDGRLAEAADHYRKIPQDRSKLYVLARFSMGEVLLQDGQIAAAEQAYREVIDLESGYVEAYSRLAYILGVTGRRRESGPYLFNILRSGTASLDELVLLADLERPVDEGAQLLEWHAKNPDDYLVQLGLASHAALDGRAEEAIPLLEAVVAEHPELAAAQCLLGELLTESDVSEFSRWHRGLPAKSEQWPDLWFVRGRWAQRAQQLEMAARCYREAVRLVPLHRRANYELGIVLARLNIESAAVFTARSKTLLDLSTLLTHVRDADGRNAAAMQNVLEILESQGRIWETCAWANLSRQIFGEADWLVTRLSRWAPKLGPDLPFLPADFDLTERVDVADFPPFQILEQPSESAVTESTDAGRIRFEQTDVGLNFVYFNANDESTPGARIQEQTGGGASVIDLDNDAWPDLYLTQGGNWVHGRPAAEVRDDYIDRMFRNRHGTQFDDVTQLAGIHETGFGQGSAVGDLNEDGFPDIYVANIGSNSLYLNNGDGTFSPDPHGATSDRSEFTSSTLIADIDGDGLADIFEANYVTGEAVYHLICSGRACSPSAFDGVPDQLHLNTGDGDFRSVPALTPEQDAKGLGTVAARLGDDTSPSIFVANDQTPNFLLTYAGATVDDSEQLIDKGLGSGLAYSQDGLVTAAMGIAADDVDHNGLIDFFITNFQDEANCLYLQNSPGFFSDLARPAGLRAPGYSMVGWGTQFLDADRDGEMDLIVSNGHVDSYLDPDKASEMRCQFFRNTGAAKFIEETPGDVGEFFAQAYFGRSVATLDWNGDGLMDFVMVPIRAETAIVTNRTEAPGHFLNVRLHARTTSRDASFSHVQVTAADRVWKKQLVAGGGYHATNERMLQFGIGRAENITELIVTWPSGQTSRILNPEIDSTITVVEGMASGTAWKSGHATSLPVVN